MHVNSCAKDPAKMIRCHSLAAASYGMDSVFEFGDDNGPFKTVHVQNPALGLRGILVIDNVACGPSIGGLRIAPDVTFEECARLARSMTLKNAAAGLPHGGGKSVIVGDPHMDATRKEQLVRAFAAALKDETQYTFGPDMGTNETAMAWVRDEIGRSVGLPTELGGIPLDELGATAWGLTSAAVAAQDFCNIEPSNARLAVQGFGSVGIHAARFLTARGATLVAASDSRGTVHNPDGLDVAQLAALKSSGGSVIDLPGVRALPVDAIIDVSCDIWIPAARPDVITADNVARLDTKLILQGANIPITADAEASLHARGVVNVPDFIANAGGVICAAMEYAGAGRTAAFDAIWQRVGDNTREILQVAASDGTLPRDAALAMARRRVRSAMATRRFTFY